MDSHQQPTLWLHSVWVKVVALTVDVEPAAPTRSHLADWAVPSCVFSSTRQVGDLVTLRVSPSAPPRRPHASAYLHEGDAEGVEG